MRDTDYYTVTLSVVYWLIRCKVFIQNPGHTYPITRNKENKINSLMTSFQKISRKNCKSK